MNIRLKTANGKVGQGIGFQQIRRITGYLVGTLDRFNPTKQVEKNLVKHETPIKNEKTVD